MRQRIKQQTSRLGILSLVVAVATSCAGHDAAKDTRPSPSEEVPAFDVRAEAPRPFEIYNVADLLMRVGGGATSDEPDVFSDVFEELPEPFDSEGLIEHIRVKSGGDAAWNGSHIEFAQGQLFVDHGVRRQR